jgi:hypothetical protein
MSTEESPRPEDEVIRARQKARARIMAWLLAAFIVLLFFITIAKMSLHR